jgi:integrase
MLLDPYCQDTATRPTHDLRHYDASTLIHAGESVVTVADRLGHSNATTVLKVYAHLIEGGEDRTRRAIDGALGSAARTKPGPDTAQATVGS